MKRWISNLFNINPEEWPRVLLLFIILALPNIGIVLGSTISYAAFLKQVGMAALPWVLISSSILSILALAVYTAFVDRIANDRLFIAIFAFGALSIILGLVMLWLNLSRIAYPVLYLLFLAWSAVVGPHLSTYINGFYDIQAAKRIMPVVSAASRGGAIVAGLTMPFITSHIAPEWIISIWLGTYLIAIATIWGMPYLLKEKKTPAEAAPVSVLGEPGQEKRTQSFFGNIREGLNYTMQSPFLRWIAISTILLMILLSLLEYKSSQILLAHFESAERFAGFMGLIDGVSNIVALPMLLLGVSRLIAWLGLGNFSLFFPIANLFVSGALVGLPGVGSAGAAYLDRKAFRTIFQSPVEALLYNAVPLRMKGRARAFVGGLIVPIGSLIGGLLLLPPRLPNWFLTVVIGTMAVGYVVTAFIIRRQYALALVNMLEQEDYSSLLSQEASDLPMADPSTLKRLQQKLEESSSHELKVFMTKLIAQIGGNQAIGILAPAILATPDPRTRSAMADVLVAANLRGEEVKNFYTQLLSDPEGLVRESAISGLETLAGPRNPQFDNQLLGLVADSDSRVRVRVLSSLIRRDDFFGLEPAVAALDQMLAAGDEQQRARGVQVLGKASDPAAVPRLLEYLSDPADAVRLEAAMAAEDLSVNTQQAVKGHDGRFNALLVEKMSSLLQDPVERVRQAALIVLGRLGSGVTHSQVIDALTDKSPAIRAAAAEALILAGKAIIPVMHARLTHPDPQLRKMALVVLSRINPKDFGPLVIGAGVTENLISIYRDFGQVEALEPCSGQRSVNILQSALREHSRRLRDEILYLLAAIHPPATIKVIGDALRSDSARARANAREALEPLTSPQIARLITPLFEPNVTPADLQSLGKDAWEMEFPDTAQAMRQIASNPEAPMLRALAIFSLGEMVAARRAAPSAKSTTPAATDLATPADDAPKAPHQERPRRAGRRAPLTDLLGAIAEGGGAAAEGGNGAGAASIPGSGNGAGNDSNLEAAAPVASLENTDLSKDLALPFKLTEIEALLEAAGSDPADEVRQAAEAARREMARLNAPHAKKEAIVLSIIDRIIFLKEVPFFGDMTIDELKVLASVCEERMFEKDMQIFKSGDPGGVLYVIINGKVGIELEKRAGSFARLADMEAYAYFGETNFFDNSPNSTSAVAITDTLTLQLRREPLIALARQNPELSLKLINVLSQRLREANDRIAELTRSRPRSLHQLYDQFD